MIRRLAMFAALAALVPTTVQAQQAITAAQRAVPWQLPAAERTVWAQAFRDVAAGRPWSATKLVKDHPEALLAGSLEAEILLARKKASAASLSIWLARNTDHPQSVRLAARARSLGVTVSDAPAAPRPMRVVSLTSPLAPKPAKPDSPAAASFAAHLRPLLGSGQAALAETRWRERREAVSEPVRTEWAQRIAWDLYQSNDDEGAIRMGMEAGTGTGEWAALGQWVAGLAAWRIGDCERAAARFDAVTAAPDDLQAAAGYWANRAHLACGRPLVATARLRAAATDSDSFYGLLARRTLGIDDTANWQEPDFIQADWNSLARLPGARRAAALAEIGQLGLADRELKHLAATADVTYYEPLLRLAARLNMPATQYWLAHRPPPGGAVPLAARFPAPDWTPNRGWRIDRALVFAHALQESNFVTDATSRAGARGVMQLMPATAQAIARSIGEYCDDARLADPSFNIEYGQTYLEVLRDSPWTQGLLPKVVAAYNAGPGSVQKWNASLRDNGDPLLFIESIPFRETRHYVEVVMRNYWMYEQRTGTPSASMEAIAANLWPRFPGLPGATAVKADRFGVAPQPSANAAAAANSNAN